jgi:hypothetical protein
VSRWLRWLAAVVVTANAMAGAARLVAPATAGTSGVPAGVVRQLAFLRGELDNGAGERAQAGFPEGYFFLHVLYGASWVEVGMRAPADQRAAPLRLPVTTFWTKRYALGLLPIGDAFLAWSKTARPWTTAPPQPPPASVSPWWRVPLLALLAVVGVAPWLPALVRRYRARAAACRTTSGTLLGHLPA